MDPGLKRDYLLKRLRSSYLGCTAWTTCTQFVQRMLQSS